MILRRIVFKIFKKLDQSVVNAKIYKLKKKYQIQILENE